MLLSQKNKKIGILGLGKTGTSSYQALSGVASVICWDDVSATREIFQTKFEDANIVNLSDPQWNEQDRILVSPGIHPLHQIIKIANSYGIDITSDIDLLFEEASGSNFIAVTGTNGKSTSTALAAHILKEADLDYPSGGNIGDAVLSLNTNKPGYVLELSSFQLDLIKSFKAKIAVLLNITPDHLDRYQTMEAYIDSKKKILSMLDENGFCIIGVDNAITKNIANSLTKSMIKIIPISALEPQPHGVSVLDNIVYDNIFESKILELQNNKRLQGTHNKENIASCYAICRILGVKPEKIITGINSFKGLPHRMEYVCSIGGISFYNDSKATNTDSASRSLDALDNIYWLAGGIVKDDNVESLSKYSNKIKKAYFFGRDKEIFAKAMNGKMEFTICADLEEAFAIAFKDAIGDKPAFKNILLAPAAASLDQFKNFEHRGEVFIRLCREITI